jgi:hypothetical protein
VIGRDVHHDTKVIMLAPGDGNPLRYQALLAGTTWPASGDRFLLETEGVKVPSDAQELNDLSARLHADYFVADDPDLGGDPQLRSYLDAHFAAESDTPGYRVYYLHHRLAAT